MTSIGTARRLITVGAVLAVSALLSGCASTVAGIAVRSPGGGRVDAAPVEASQLEDVLLTIGELNAIMGSSTMEVTAELEEMTDHSELVSEPDCLGAIYGAEEPVYAGSGWTDMRDQVAREPDEDNDHWVEQTAVLYPSADKAQQFFDESAAAWQRCNDSTVTVTSSGDDYLWSLDDVAVADTLITQLTTQEGADGWACQHALSVVSNLTAEAWACGYSITDEGAVIATGMAENASR